ncbi:MAG: hypothetical protein CMQ15_18125 [Gammaproteobacteria bacterium]|nr:hypothetical protein [Gammaproteobacteria bacterium]|tara:strand:- start:950 stop:1870 length:921 start_codon:yes stop_codon:yes gene_type:complete
MNKYRYIGLLIVCVVGGYFVRNNLHEFNRFKNVTLSIILFLSIMNVLGRLIIGFRIKIVANIFNVNLHIMEWFGISAINSFYNYLITKSGTFANALYLKKKYSISFQDYLATFLSIHVLTMLAAGLTGISAILFAKVNGYNFDLTIALFFIALIIFSLILIFMRRLTFSIGRLFRKLHQLTKGWSTIRRSKKLLTILLGCELLILFFLAVRYFVVAKAFGYAIPLWVCFLMSPLTVLSQLIGITPAALGIREAVVGTLTHILGFGLQAGVMVTALDRVVAMVVTFILGPLFSYFLLKNIDKKTKNS